jgi:hypothetical protein
MNHQTSHGTRSAIAVIVAFLFCLLTYTAAAQPPPPHDPNSVPLGGGLPLLLAAGAAVAGWKYRSSRRRKPVDGHND